MNVLPSTGDQRGIALPVALFMMLILTLIGYGLTISSMGGTRVSTSFHAQQNTFEIADAGLDRGKELARQQLLAAGNPDTTVTYTQMLTAAAGGDGVLVNPLALANFGLTNGFTNATADVPFVPYAAGEEIDGSAYQVFLSNDRSEGNGTALADTDNRIMLTSFGSGPNQVGFTVLQAEYVRETTGIDLPDLPALLVLPGPYVDIDTYNSNAAEMNGDGGTPECWGTIGVTADTAIDAVENAISNRPNSYQTCNPAGGGLVGADTVENFLRDPDLIDPTWTNPYHETPSPHDPVLREGAKELIEVAYLNGLITQLAAVADFKGANGFSDPTHPNFSVGSPNDPRIVVVNGDLSINPSISNGAGIIAVTGTLTMRGNFSFDGVIYAIGQGRIVRNGGGNGLITGGALVADTQAPWDGCFVDNAGNPTGVCDAALAGLYAGVPEYVHTGGGTSTFGASDFEDDGGSGLLGKPLRRVSFQQLR